MLDKLHNILNGWKNYIFEDKAVESLAKARAVECAKCDNAVYGMIAVLIEDEIEDIKGLVCDGCEGSVKCPLSTKLRSVDEKCPENKWTR